MPDAGVSPTRSHQVVHAVATSSSELALEGVGRPRCHSAKRPAMFSRTTALNSSSLLGKVEEERALGDAGARGDLLGARRGEALLDEQVERGVEQFLRTRFLAALAGAGRGGVAVRMDR